NTSLCHFKPLWAIRPRTHAVLPAIRSAAKQLGPGRWRLDQLQRLAGGRRGRLAAARNLDSRKGELYAIGIEGLLDHGHRPAADHEVLARLGHELDADLNGKVAELLDPLHLQGLNDVGAELRILGQLLADLLDQLARLVEVG